MPQVRDTAVKLFGWTITSGFHDSSDKEDSSSSSSSLRLHMMNNQSASHNSEQDNPSLKTLSDLDNVTKETSDNSNDQHSEITTATTSEEKTTDLKKPDKILPCPRCNSVDTKFCYYNNYNVNQPRHFCRNCQRYWTSGGTMRTVPVGSGRRKNKGWVSSDHYLNITSDNTNNDYTNSSTKFLSFESSEYFVTKKDKHQSTDANITADSISQKSNNFQGFLPPQVTSHASPTWPYPYPPSPSFYHLPVYWGYMEPVWSTLATSTCLGKRTRDESSHKSVKESKAAFVKFRTKREKTDQFTFFLDGSETKSSNKSFVPEPYLTLQANPAAMARSMNFREST